MSILRILGDITPEMQQSLDDSLKRLPRGTLDVGVVMNWVYILLGMIAVGFIVYGAIQYATAHGDPSKAARGKNSIIYAVIGLVIVLLAAVITNFVFGVMS